MPVFDWKQPSVAATFQFWRSEPENVDMR